MKKTIRKTIFEEFKKNPITVTVSVIGILISGSALLLALLQYNIQPEISNQRVTISPGIFNPLNLTITIAFFLSLTFSAASLIRLIARKYGFLAFFVSIIIAVFTGFFSLLVLELVPPVSISSDGYEAIKDLVIYGTTLIFIAINGSPIIHRTMLDEDVNPDSAPGFFVVIVFLLLVWYGLVSSGITKLASAFLAQSVISN